MDTFNAFNPEPEVEKSRWFTGPTFTTFLIGLIIGFSVNSFFGSPLLPGDGVVSDDADTTENTAALEDVLDTGKATNKADGDGSLTGEKAVVPSSVASGENILVVSNQPAGDKVVVSMVSIAMNGWVTVRETDANGALGNILGARRFNAGKYFGETVELLRGTKEDAVYAVVLHADDGDREFDYTREVPLKDKNGNLVSGTFTATGLLAE